MSLCKLCGDFLDELLDALKIISNKQRLLLDGTVDASAKLAPIVEEVDDEQVDHTVMGVAAKVMKIQEKMMEVENNDEAILEKCNNKLKQSNAYLIKISNENEKLKAMTKDIKDRMNNLQLEKDDEAQKSARNREDFFDLVSKFEDMQNHFLDLEDNLKNITVAQDEHFELEKIKKLLSEANHANIELDSQLSRSDRMLKDKGFLVDSLTKQLLDLESKNMFLMKERDSERKQKNTIEGQLKSLQESLETIEKDRMRFSGLVQEKELYIARLEEENHHLESEFMSERSMTARDLEDFEGSMKGLNRTVKLKENEIEALKRLANDYQGEIQKLVHVIAEKEMDIGIWNKRCREAEMMYEDLVKECDERKSFFEESYCLSTDSEGRNVKELENAIFNMAKELRAKDREIEDLGKLVESWRCESKRQRI